MSQRRSVFGRNLRYLITVSGTGPSIFARDMGIDYSLVKRYMSGEIVPRTERLEQIAKQLGVSPGCLLFNELTPEVEGVPHGPGCRD